LGRMSLDLRVHCSEIALSTTDMTFCPNVLDHSAYRPALSTIEGLICQTLNPVRL
jgi:hypothetical protein